MNNKSHLQKVALYENLLTMSGIRKITKVLTTADFNVTGLFSKFVNSPPKPSSGNFLSQTL